MREIENLSPETPSLALGAALAEARAIGGMAAASKDLNKERRFA